MKKLVILFTVVAMLSGSVVMAQNKRGPMRSPNGKHIAVIECFSSDGSWHMTIDKKFLFIGKEETIADLADNVSAEIVDPIGFTQFHWSPDSKTIAFVYMTLWHPQAGVGDQSIGVVDVRTRQVAWIAGDVAGKDFDIPGDDSEILKWKDSTTLLYRIYSSETGKNISQARWKAVSVGGIEKGWSENYRKAKNAVLLTEECIKCLKTGRSISGYIDPRYKSKVMSSLDPSSMKLLKKEKASKAALSQVISGRRAGVYRNLKGKRNPPLEPIAVINALYQTAILDVDVNLKSGKIEDLGLCEIF